MNQQDASVEQLQARIDELEAEIAQRAEGATATRGEGAIAADAAVPAPRSAGARRTRSVFSAILIVLALVLSPLAVLTGTLKPLLTDTDAFVAAYAPLANDPSVQATVTNASINAINEAVDLDTIATELFDGLETLNLPPRAIAALGLLKGPAVSGAQSLIERGVTTFVSSPQFADVWRQMLVVAHTQFVETMNASPDAALSISNGGLVLNLRPLVAEVRERLVANGIGLASNIPDVDRTIQLVQSDALVTARVIYLVSVAVGTWLPIVTLIMLALGIAVAVNHRAALVRGALALGIIMLFLWVALSIGRSTASVLVMAPAIAPGTIDALYDATLANTVRASIAVGFVGFAAAFAGWFGGNGRLATRLRGFASTGARGIRRAAADHRITTGSFGRALDRFHALGVLVIIAVAVIVLLFGRPLTVAFVIWTLVLALVAVFVLEVLRLPEEEAAAAAARSDMDVASAPDGGMDAGTATDVDELGAGVNADLDRTAGASAVTGPERSGNASTTPPTLA